MQQLPGDIVQQNIGEPNSGGSNLLSSAGSGIKSDLSSFIPSDINNTLSKINDPKAFGQQLLDKTKDKVIGAALGYVQQLQDEIERTVFAKIELEKNHVQKLYDLALKKVPKTTYEFGRTIETPAELTEGEYQAEVDLENASYERAKKIIDDNLANLGERLKRIILDPYIKAKENYLKFKADLVRVKTNRGSLKALYKSEKVQQLKKNIFKTLVAVTATLLTEQLIKIIADSNDLQELVDKTNDIIDAAQTINELNQARIARNSCISKINQQENRIKAVLNVLNVLNVILTVFGILVALLNAIPGWPAPVAKKLATLWVNAKQIRDGIGVTLSILIPMLQSAIAILEDLKNQLREINQRIEEKTLQLLTDDELTSYLEGIKNSSEDPSCNTNRLPGEIDEDYYDRLRNSSCIKNLLAQQNPTADPLDLSNAGLLNLAQQITPPNANDFGTYKGFKFIIKEENDPKFVVRGNKRHYAVAVNTKEVEQVKSDYSFTLNPQQLVDQLKFIIDQQNLQG
jgi:CHASE3 domain sensor protein